ncbi:hypothetical protein RvY_15899-2 [Ramazzottius varieornatus]|uniref:HRDC domain-containing protein n=1 Tax=Ramazzottius varieornatus TaxID=947166 RepID=A0A1D1VWK1_RAMVA|nr:hypothetical protein RvY_15899-2 [Ramazzottius varieornatus]
MDSIGWNTTLLTGTSQPGVMFSPSSHADETSISFCGYPSTTHFVKDLKLKLVGVVDAGQKLPHSEMDYLVCSTFPEYVEGITTGSIQLANMMKNLAWYWGMPAQTCRHFDTPQNKTAVLQGVFDATKQLKERMDLTLDELARLKEEHMSTQAEKISGIVRSPVVNRYQLRATTVQRPQVSNGWKVDNSRSPFVPKITVKPNAVRSLEDSLRWHRQDGTTAPHPYQVELDMFVPEAKRLVASPPLPAKPSDQTHFVYVDTPDEFRAALNSLMSASEIAVDLEHHSYRTYLGITCLLQISSRTADYVFDTIALRDHMSELNVIFTNSAVLKVFHGGNMDIQWLQRDFGIYVVNMFDTGQASRALQLPKFSLAFLMQQYLGKIVDKTHQTSDWRLRPLPDDMLNYARSDTHDLLFLHDCVRNDLIKKDPSLQLLKTVYAQSKEICLQRYEKQTLDVNDFAFIMWKFAKNFSEQQKYALKKILEWRDDVARDLDESIGYVLPTKACIDLAEELPRTSDDLVKCLEFVPLVVKQKIHQVLSLLKDARAFQGVVPVPVSEFTPAQADTEAQDAIQRKVPQPVTGAEFVSRFLDVVPPVVQVAQLSWSSSESNVGQNTARNYYADIWESYLSVQSKENEEKETGPAFVAVADKPNLHVSVPKDLPLVDAGTAKTKKPQSDGAEREHAVYSRCSED